MALGKGALSRELGKALGKDFFVFSCNDAARLGRQVTLFFLECCTRGRGPLPSAALSRVPFPECNSSPSAILGKDWLPRVSGFLHSGKPATLKEILSLP
jgi:hypothetical protein